MAKKTYSEIVDGFLFHTPQMAEKAKRETEGVRYVRQRLDMGNPESVLKVYNKLRGEKTFETPVGMSFMRELQEYLRTVPFIKESEIAPIDFEPVVEGANRENREIQNERLKRGREKVKLDEKKRKSEKKQKKTEEKDNIGREKYQRLFIVNILLVIAVAAMMAITATSDMPTIINYENKLIDRYEQWDKELTEREEKVKEYEEKYGIRE